MNEQTAADTDPVAQLEGFLNTDPGNEDLRVAAFEAALRSGQRARAFSHVREALRHGAEPTAWRWREAHVHMAAREWALAVELLEVVRSQAEAPQALREAAAQDLALIALREGRAEDGLALVRGLMRADEVPPESIQVLWLRLLHHADRVDEGLADAAVWESRGLMSAEAAGAGSLMAFDAGRMDLATRWADAALASRGGHLEALVTRGSLALAGSSATAARNWLERALQVNPDDGRTLSALAFADLLAADVALSRERFERAVQLLPKHIGTWHGAAWSALLANDVMAARGLFETALALDRNFAETHGGLAVVLARLGERRAAQEEIDVALRLDRRCLSAQYARAVLEGRAQDPHALQALARRYFGEGGRVR